MAVRALPGPALSERTTLRLGGRARAEFRLESAEDACALGEALASQEASPLMLGFGSNILAMDHDLNLAVVSLGRDVEPEIVGTSQDARLVRVFGGYSLPRLVVWAAKRGLSGLEGLSGIPGSVGGAVAGNAGSFGRQTAELLERVRIWTPAGSAWIGHGEWQAGYRTFAPKGVMGPWLVVEAQVRLTQAESGVVRAVGEANLARKKATQPVQAATCGCAFKNPPGHSAGRLLDECGFRGFRLGGMAFSAVHANFLVNEGGGSARAALELIEMARGKVRERYGVDLELEVRVVA